MTTYNITSGKETEIISSRGSVEFKGFGPLDSSAVFGTNLVRVYGVRSESIRFKLVKIQGTLSNSTINKSPILLIGK
jgi:hypothetical protein